MRKAAENSNHFPIRRMPALVFAVICWSMACFCLAWGSIRPARDNSSPEIVSPEYRAKEINHFQMIKRDPADFRRPLLGIQFESLEMENGTLGPFRTGLHQVANVRNLKVQLKGSEMEVGQAAEIFSPLAISPPEEAGIKLGGEFSIAELMGEQLDLSNTSEVRVSGFELRKSPGETGLTIKCRRATMRYDEPAIRLEGHVILEAGGRRLESNRVEWHPREKFFAVQGNYWLRGAEERAGGGNQFLDENLQPMGLR